MAVDVEGRQSAPGASFAQRPDTFRAPGRLSRPSEIEREPFNKRLGRVRQQLLRWMGVKKPNSRPSRSYRYLARQIAADFPSNNGGRTILFTSPAPLKFSNEALLMFSYFMHDELGCRILLIDGTFSDSGVAGVLTRLSTPGLLDLIYGHEHKFADLVRPTQRPGICFMPAGRVPADPSLPIQVRRITDLFREACTKFDYVLIQQGSAFKDTRYLQFARAADLVLMLVAEGDTLVDDLERCMNVFRDHQISNVRLALNVPQRGTSASRVRPFGRGGHKEKLRPSELLLRWMGLKKPGSRASRSYRYLARQIEIDFPSNKGGRTILFTSPAPLKFSNEALLMFSYFMHDELGCRILLIDGTFGDGGVGGALGHHGAPGLLDFIYGDEHSLADLIKPTQRPNICFMPAGQVSTDQLLPIQVGKIADLFREARARFDYVLIQQGSIFRDTRYLQFAGAADLVLMLVAEGDTLVEELERCMSVFRDHQISNVRLLLSVPD